MRIQDNREGIILLAGDLLSLVAALWATLVVRYGELPTIALWKSYSVPFAFIFLFWVVVYFIFDLYGRKAVVFRTMLLSSLTRAQLVNSAIAVLVFYFVPFLTISPKRTLAINLLLSLLFVLVWRLYLSPMLFRGTRQSFYLLGSGALFEQVRAELEVDIRHRVHLADALPLLELESGQSVTVVADFAHAADKKLEQQFSHLIRHGAQFIDIHTLYEQLFDRVSLELVNEQWCIEHLPSRSKYVYDLAKRVMDCVIALPLGIVSLCVYPFVALAIKLDDGGSVFIKQERVGKDGVPFMIYKFRSMTSSDSGREVLRSKGQVTRVGQVLRVTRVDELPQLWSVLRGELSLVGPRPELPALVDVYRGVVPYYDIRHTIKPGLSGWAQIYHDAHPHHGTAVEQTCGKLAYDLYYVKNRSFLLDLEIALKTVKTLVSFAGR